MARFNFEIKDNLVNAVGAKLGNPDNPQEAITAFFQKIADDLAHDVVETTDPDVLQKKAEYDALLAQKREEARVNEAKEIESR